MKKSRLLLLPFLLFIFTITSCDNDTSSNAQDTIEEPGGLSCPCFTKDEIVDAFDGMGLVFCQVGSVSVSLGGDMNDPDFEVACDANISNCSCTNMGQTQDIGDLVASVCLLELMNSTLQLSGVGVETLACEFLFPQ
ncbi:MAG: hypothetical protein DHS20C13_02400 [Thermodesulfobacteriota bacterium]|nr:MAG: hypothetical protein DHS20C13_02400 [Thermodesulfobacteriota bacterium]